MNKIILMGRLTNDVDLRHTQDGQAVGRFNLAVNRVKDGADFFRCVSFGKNAENLTRYVHKGQQVLIEGRVQFGNYTNKEGQKVYTTDVIVERFEFCGSRSDNGNSTGSTNANYAPADTWSYVPDDANADYLPFN